MAANNTFTFAELHKYMNNGSDKLVKLFMVTRLIDEVSIKPMCYYRSEIKDLLPGDEVYNRKYLVLYNEDDAGLYINVDDLDKQVATIVSRPNLEVTLHIAAEDAYKTARAAYMDMGAKILARRLELKSEIDELDMKAYNLRAKMAECDRIIAGA